MKDGLQARRVFSYLFIFAIAAVFVVQFGPGSTGFGSASVGGTASAAATVNGREIPLREFNRAYAAQLQFFRGRGNPIPESLAKQIGIPQQVLDQLVNTELLAQAAERHGVAPSDAELRELIHQNPDFQKEGRFDFQRYKEVLSQYYRKTAPEYEEDLRRRLAAAKMLEVVESGASVSEDELKARFEKEGNQAKVVFVRFLPAMFAEKVAAPKPAQLEAYRTEHEKEIAAYYETNRFVYQKPERIRARQILVKLAPDGNEAQQQQTAAARAAELKKAIDGGKDFSAVARESSEDLATKEAGGELGWVERGALPLEVADAAFALSPGAVSGPVATPTGVYLVKVEEKQAAQNRALDEVKDEIARSLFAKDQARTLAEAEAKRAIAKVQGGATLKQLYPAEKDGQPALLRFETETRPEAVETDSFTASGESIPHLGPAPALVNAVFESDGPRVLETPFNVGEGFVVAQVTERKKPNPADFEKQKPELLTQARQAKQAELRNSFVQALKKQGQVETHSEALASVTEEG